jgi:L-ascorbate metabolism protein UlaG (beta-lactamase superfamily)
MTITKIGHSCLIIETDGTRILTDPGSWNALPDITDLDAILVSHEHGDHFDIGKIQELLARNPDAVVITHEAVGKKLQESGIQYTAIEPGQAVEVKGVPIESYGTEHAIIYGDASPCRNTGFLIAGRVFMPGDALHDVPPKHVEILALPTGGPWMKIAEAVDYALAVKPEKAFPIHDALYTPDVRKHAFNWVAAPLEKAGIIPVPLDDGDSEEF